MLPSTIILMGPCGCGKTVIGQILAQRTGSLFEDADDFHTDAAKEKMRSGTPLTDEDRWPWYAKLRARIVELRNDGKPYILACSALKEVYRARLREEDDAMQLRFVFLDGSFELIRDRMAQRKGHYMPLSLLESQFAILQRPEDAIRVSIDATPEQIAADILSRFASP